MKHSIDNENGEWILTLEINKEISQEEKEKKEKYYLNFYENYLYQKVSKIVWKLKEN
jgi:hypothetical protein